jgi:hypothetical protein
MYLHYRSCEEVDLVLINYFCSLIYYDPRRVIQYIDGNVPSKKVRAGPSTPNKIITMGKFLEKKTKSSLFVSGGVIIEDRGTEKKAKP